MITTYHTSLQASIIKDSENMESISLFLELTLNVPTTFLFLFLVISVLGYFHFLKTYRVFGELARGELKNSGFPLLISDGYFP